MIVGGDLARIVPSVYESLYIIWNKHKTYG